MQAMLVQAQLYVELCPALFIRGNCCRTARASGVASEKDHVEAAVLSPWSKSRIAHRLGQEYPVGVGSGQSFC